MGSKSSSTAVADPRFGAGRTVAVIGAGISGVCAAAHLQNQGLQVTVFERSSIAGGIWHYDDRVPEDPPYPNQAPSSGDYKLSKPGEFAYSTPPPESQDERDGKGHAAGSESADDLEVRFAPPGPCYAGLKNNISTNVLVSSLGPWPENTEPHVSQEIVEKYIQTLARDQAVDAITHFHARVDEAKKTPDGSKWEIRSVLLVRDASGPRLVERLSYFDLLVVASGHYGMPRIPEIEGLKEWKAAFPEHVIHSKRYRKPHPYQGRNVLVLGAGVSSLDICRELEGVANTTYQSVRGGPFDTPARMLPPNSIRIGEVEKFVLGSPSPGDTQSAAGPPILGTVVLKDGQVLDNIHDVVIATGYVTSYPFLPQLQSDTAPVTEAGEDLVVTSDGRMAHNLHHDIFYINDPTLAFVGVPYYVSTFSLFDYQAQALSRVFAGTARLPPKETMRAAYVKRVQEKGLGRAFHALHLPGQEVGYVRELINWVNEDAKELGGEPMQAPSEAWIKDYDELKAKLALSRLFDKDPVEAEAVQSA
ncbi:hypothetical protein B0T24DRAFT_615399 [Lasiosphaeria ovina]|uniref:Dimethylaniline monooxygenase n=1 Tax=Lasiosphaeria ovina TaxID=92902 RepID=A0AAE0NFB0_9PEZI|nr:hypothetical protein B0T24DRAFT_615399 [Lasiosphaeria ovina]